MALMLALGAGAAAVAAPAASATAATAGCRLPGYVSPGPSRPCSPSPTSGPPAGDSLLGHVAGSVAGGLVNGVFKELAGVALISAGAALRVTGSLIATTTRPALGSTWFSAAYWRVAAVSTLLTLPFLFAAGVHALVRTDLALIGRAAFGYLPLALLGVSIAAPLTTLVLAATDEMSADVARAAGGSDSAFLARAASHLATPSLIHGDLFLAFIVAVLTIVAAISLWIELLIRGASVDVIVLMLPLFFAAMVWPARRVWAVRAIETLIALILSKFAIVAVLTLGGAALSQLADGPAALLTGATLILLATLAPWALLRLLPLHEVAAAAAGGLSQTPRNVARQAQGHLPSRRGAGVGAPRDGDPADGAAASAGPEDAATAMIGRLAAGDRLGGARGGQASRGGGDGGDDDDEAAMSPVTREGVRATENAGQPAPGQPVLSSTTSTGVRRRGDRPVGERSSSSSTSDLEFTLDDPGAERVRWLQIDGDGARPADDGPAIDPPPAVDPPPDVHPAPDVDPPPPADPPPAVDPPAGGPVALLPPPAGDDGHPPAPDDDAA